MTEILVLLLLFQLKHLIADYYLQFPYMYKNKGKKENWFGPLLDHTIMHASGTALIIFFYFGYANKMSLYYLLILISMLMFDLITHFITDRWKATRKTDPSQSWFWHSLGIDQMIHHIVGILIVFGIVAV